MLFTNRESANLNLPKQFSSFLNKIFARFPRILYPPKILTYRQGTKSTQDMSNSEDTTALNADEDSKWVSLCQKGDTDAFECLVKKHQKKVLNVAYRMIGDYEEACEVVQDTFLSCYKSIGKFRGESTFSTWLYAIALNLSRNRRKQLKGRSLKEILTIDAPSDRQDGRPHLDPPAPEPSALEQMEKKELQARLEECLKGLDEEQREVIVLRDVQGFSYEEIRDILKTQEGTVKSRLFRARNSLKECLKKSIGRL